MELKKQIIAMIEKIDDEHTLKFIYHFLLNRLSK